MDWANLNSSQLSSMKQGLAKTLWICIIWNEGNFGSLFQISLRRLLPNNNETDKVCYLWYILSIFSWLVKNCVVHQNTVFNSLKFLYTKGYDRRKRIGLIKNNCANSLYINHSLINRITTKHWQTSTQYLSMQQKKTVWWKIFNNYNNNIWI